MLLRRITKHVTDQNWFAVFLDFLIVVFGVYIGLQVQEWAAEKKRLDTEHQYLERLHDEVEQLSITRSLYDESRQRASQDLFEINEIILSTDNELSLSDEQCRVIAHSAFTTIPPAELPSATELISSGRLDQIESESLKDSILSYIQDAARVRDLIATLSESNVDLSRKYSSLMITNLTHTELSRDSIDLVAQCDVNELRANQAFINDFNVNAYLYIIYTERGVVEVSHKLAEVHLELDQTLGITHSDLEEF